MPANETQPSDVDEVIHETLRIVISQGRAADSKALRDRLAASLRTFGTGDQSLYLTAFLPQTLQRLVAQDYVTEAHMAVKQLSSQRNNVIAVSNALTHAMLFRQFDIHVFACLAKGEPVQRWNRRNPRAPIDSRTLVTQKNLSELIGKKIDPLLAAKEALLPPLAASLSVRKDLQGGERQKLLALFESSVSLLTPRTLYALSVSMTSAAKAETVRRLVEVEQRYLGRFAIADYVAMLVIELLMFLDRQKRDAPRLSPLELGWRIRERRLIEGDRAKLWIAISSKGSLKQEVGREIYGRTNLPVKEKSLLEFYDGTTRARETATLGLYYLSFLKAACAKADILFDSFVSQSTDEKECVLNLTFLF